MPPWFALFWKKAGENGWTCVGLYETEDEARTNFDEWESVYDGLLVISRGEQIGSIQVCRASDDG